MASVALLLIAALEPTRSLVVASSETANNPTAPEAATPANSLCTSPPCARLISGWLHTNPGITNIYDDDGNVVHLQGVNVDGLDFGTGTSWRTPDACRRGWSFQPSSFVNVASWGFNSVRIPISWENLEPTPPSLAANGTWIHHWNSAYLDELDMVVSQFAAAHIAVIFDFAQVDVSPAFQQAPEKVQGGECEGWGNPTWLYPTITSPTNGQELASAMCSFFNDQSLVGNDSPRPVEAMEAAEGMLASHYLNTSTVVGIDMFNEPWFASSCGPLSALSSLLTSYYANMGQIISGANPHLLLIFEDSTPGLMHTAPILNSPPSFVNAVYEFHIYTSTWTTAQPYVQAFLGKAKSWGVPVWMGEFDAFEAGCTGVNCKLDPNWQADTEAMLTFCNSEGVNWAYFSYYSLGTNLHTPIPHSEILATLRSEITAT